MFNWKMHFKMNKVQLATRQQKQYTSAIHLLKQGSVAVKLHLSHVILRNQISYLHIQLPVITLLRNPTVAIVMLLAKCHKSGGFRNFLNIQSMLLSSSFTCFSSIVCVGVYVCVYLVNFISRDY